MAVVTDDIATVLGLERELQTHRARSDPDRLRVLLAPDFVEIGASGRRWDRTSVLALLADETGDDPEIVMSAVEARRLGPDVVQVFWESDTGGRRARRTSLWLRRDGAWAQVFHQGTPLT